MNEELDQETISDLERRIDKEIWPLYVTERDRAKKIDKWLHGGPPVTAKKASPEHKALAAMARTPWLLTVSTVSVQMLLMEGVYSSERPGDKLADVFRPWVANRMDSRQVPVYSSAVNYGVAYVKAIPGDTAPVIYTYSPKSMIALYEDVSQDQYPQIALAVAALSGERWRLTLTDDKYEHYWVRDAGGKLDYQGSSAHGVGFCPVVRYADNEDAEGQATGEIERLIDTASRLNKTTYDRLLVQHYNSFKVRTATGLEVFSSPEEEAEAKLKLANDDLLLGSEGTQFGTLSETALDPFQSAHDADREDLAAVSQTPLPAVGKMINVGDDGVTAAWAGLHAKSGQRKRVFGQANVDLLKLCAQMSNVNADFTINGVWSEIETINLSQAADAYGKLAQQLGIPASLLIPKLPNLTEDEAREWVEYMKENPSPDEITARSIAGQLESAL